MEDDGVSNAVMFSLIACLIIFVFLMICIVVLYRKNKELRSPPSINPISPSPIPETKVFLLYAKDCQPFMDMMEAFRTVLSIEGKFEVSRC